MDEKDRKKREKVGRKIERKWRERKCSGVWQGGGGAQGKYPPLNFSQWENFLPSNDTKFGAAHPPFEKNLEAKLKI